MIKPLKMDKAEYKPSKRITKCKNCYADFMEQTAIEPGQMRFVLSDSQSFGGALRHATLCKSCFEAEIKSLESSLEEWKQLLRSAV